jgi:hypothetical protein
MNRILLLIGFLVSTFSCFAADYSKTYHKERTFQVDTTPITCAPPEGLFASTRDTIASLNWLSRGANAGYSLQWKLKNDSIWKTVDALQNTYILRGIKSCSEYEFRVKTLCGLSGMSAYSETKKFKTIGCTSPCTTPREIASQTGDNKATFKWGSSNSRAYEIQIKDVSNNGDWRTEIVIGNAFTALNLRPCTKYAFHVRSICADATSTTPIMYSEWSSTITVATTGCSALCLAPRKIYYSSTTTATVIKWDSIRGGTYELQVKGSLDSVWRTISGITRPFYELSSLSNCAIYQARVRVICSPTSNSPWSYVIRFKTGGCQEVCKTPSALKVYVADSVAVFSWVAPNATKFVFQYKTEADATWKSLNVTGNVYVLTGLNRCQKYIARIQTVCSSTSSSDYSNEIKFETKGCQTPSCVSPTNLKSIVLQDTIVYINWVGQQGLFEVQYQMAGALDWRSVSVQTLEHKLVLPKCKAYYWRVRRVCDNGFSNWSELGKFETKGCTTPQPCDMVPALNVNLVSDSIVQAIWLSSQSKYEIQYRVISSNQGDWISEKFERVYDAKLKLRPCQVYEIRIRAICDDGSLSNWSVSVKIETKGCVSNCAMPQNLKTDLAQDTIVYFNWAASQNAKYELQYKPILDIVTDWVSVSVNASEYKLVLKRCTTYYWRVRRICDNGVGEWSELGKFETKGCTPVIPLCEIQPTSLNTMVVRDTIAELVWFGTTAAKYEVQYRLSGSGDAGWQSATTAVPSFRIAELKRCTVYEWKVRNICANNMTSPWSGIQKIVTTGCVTNGCADIRELKIILTGTTAHAIWTELVGNRDSIFLQYRKSTDSLWSNVLVAGFAPNPNGIEITGLENCKEYKVRARRKCASGLFSDWVEVSFKVANNCLVGEEVSINSLSRKAITSASVYPNPGNDYIQVEYDLVETADVKVQMVNLQGQVVKQLDNSLQDAGNYMQVLDNIGDMQEGLYFIIIRTDGKVSMSQKWMKQ